MSQKSTNKFFVELMVSSWKFIALAFSVCLTLILLLLVGYLMGWLSPLFVQIACPAVTLCLMQPAMMWWIQTRKPYL